MHAYHDRDLLLRELGFASYSHYLGGELWKSIRARVITAAKGKCFCGRRAEQVHHQDYRRETLIGSDLTALVAICARCHRKIELSRSGNKRTLEEANRRLSELRSGDTDRKKRKVRIRVKCARCDKKATKGSLYCRPCSRLARFGREHKDSVYLPLCQGRDCTHQAAIGKDYCRIHASNPSLSLKEYMAARKKIRKAGIRI